MRAFFIRASERAPANDVASPASSAGLVPARSAPRSRVLSSGARYRQRILICGMKSDVSASSVPRRFDRRRIGINPARAALSFRPRRTGGAAVARDLRTLRVRRIDSVGAGTRLAARVFERPPGVASSPELFLSLRGHNGRDVADGRRAVAPRGDARGIGGCIARDHSRVVRAPPRVSRGRNPRVYLPDADAADLASGAADHVVRAAFLLPAHRARCSSAAFPGTPMRASPPSPPRRVRRLDAAADALRSVAEWDERHGASGRFLEAHRRRRRRATPRRADAAWPRSSPASRGAPRRRGHRRRRRPCPLDRLVGYDTGGSSPAPPPPPSPSTTSTRTSTAAPRSRRTNRRHPEPRSKRLRRRPKRRPKRRPRTARANTWMSAWRSR